MFGLLERPCQVIDGIAKKWWAEVLWFISAALASYLAVASWLRAGFFDGRWVEALTALGTISAVVVALGISISTRYAEKRYRKTQAHVYVRAIYRPLTKLGSFLAESKFKLETGSLEKIRFTHEANRHAEFVRNLNFSKLLDFDERLFSGMSMMRDGLENLLENFYHFPQTDNGRKIILEGLISLSANNIGLVMSNYSVVD
ncbi:hypothetical protein [Alcaligenes faecalis]|uniref:hypothetical protein n=2 Tax=Alcaligenes faecalis TaxID=511 RepID=UPI0011C01FFA|nr:hypothetical protein [Alcaligenes faecalis]